MSDVKRLLDDPASLGERERAALLAGRRLDPSRRERDELWLGLSAAIALPLDLGAPDAGAAPAPTSPADLASQAAGPAAPAALGAEAVRTGPQLAAAKAASAGAAAKVASTGATLKAGSTAAGASALKAGAAGASALKAGSAAAGASALKVGSAAAGASALKAASAGVAASALKAASIGGVGLALAFGAHALTRPATPTLPPPAHGAPGSLDATALPAPPAAPGARKGPESTAHADPDLGAPAPPEPPAAALAPSPGAGQGAPALPLKAALAPLASAVSPRRVEAEGAPANAPPALAPPAARTSAPPLTPGLPDSAGPVKISSLSEMPSAGREGPGAAAPSRPAPAADAALAGRGAGRIAEAAVVGGGTPSPAGPAASSEAAKRGASAPAIEDAAREESRLVGEARRRLRSGDAAGALAGVDELARRFPQGVLAQERALLRIEALAAAGRGDEARAGAIAFVRAYPKSPFEGRARALGR